MRLIDADALVWKIMVLCRSYQKTHLVHAEMLETFTNSVLAYIDHAEEHKTEVKVIQYDSNLPTEPSKSTDQNVADVPSGDLISRADAIDSINKTNSTLDEIPICKDIRSAFANAIKALPSADRPQVNQNSAEEQIADTCDRPKGECDDNPQPYVPEASTERVVHCKDCIYSEEVRDGNDMFACNNINGMPGYVRGDDFCSSGSL